MFLAAYDMYKQPGNPTKMEKVQEQFPSVEEMHIVSMKEGGVVRGDCWIDTSTTIRKRNRD